MIKRTLSLAAASFALVTTSQAANLAAFWDFNDVSDAASAVDSVAGNVGTLQNGAVYTTDGGGHSGAAGDYAVDLSGGGMATVMASAAFLNTTADSVTFSFWQTNDVVSSSAFWAESPSSPNGARGAQAHVPWSNGSIFFDTAGCCATDATRIVGAPAAGFDFSVWHHYAFIKDGDDKSVWIDGALAFAGGGTTDLPTDFTNLWIGSERGTANSPNGLIDEFAVFQGALTPSEIGQIAGGLSAGEIPEPSTSLLAVFAGALALIRRRR